MPRRGAARTGTCLGVLTGAVVALALASPAHAVISVGQTQSAEVVKPGQDVTYTITVTNTGSGVEESVDLFVGSVPPSEFPRTAFAAPNNPYRSMTPSQGTCEVFASNAAKANCSLGSLNPGAGAQIVAVATVNESVDHLAEQSFCRASTCRAVVTTVVNEPPEVEGSKKIKVKGLPSACADRDFKLTATAKGAERVKGTYSGPRTAEGKPPPPLSPAELRFGKLGTANGSKLKATFPAGRLDSGYYQIKIAARYDGKPKQKTEIFLQRCGVPP